MSNLKTKQNYYLDVCIEVMRETEENNTELLNMIRSVSKLKYIHIVLTGDYNLPDINWDLWTTKSENPNNISYKFIECLRDNFMFQHV